MDERERRHDARRLDAVVAETTGLTRSQARALIVAGKVRVDGDPATKPGTGVRAGAQVAVAEAPRYVSRGGEKLEGALQAFGIDVTGLDALDVGASTGGFTDALLQHGARAVTALDVGYGQLAWKLRGDPRVRVIERTNVRTLADDAFPDGFDLIVIDASFISLRTIVGRAAAFMRVGGAIVALVKPQFEAGRERIGGGGVVRDAGGPRRGLARGARRGAPGGAARRRGGALAAARPGRQRRVLLRAAPRRRRGRRRAPRCARRRGAREPVVQ